MVIQLSTNQFYSLQLPACYRRQSGFVLFSVMLAAIIIGTIALYNARLTQAEIESQQVQRTTQRMQQWLLAALAYRYANGRWPITLDYARNAKQPPSSLKAALPFDLVGQGFMPSAIENYQTPSDFAAIQSPTDTSWVLPPSRNLSPNDNYLIKRDDINDDCYNKYYSDPGDFADACQIVESPDNVPPFKIVAHVPIQQIAEQIAAKLPAASVKPRQNHGQTTGWEVHAYVTQTSVQSQSDTPGANSFASGFLPMVPSSDNQIAIINQRNWHTDASLGLPIRINKTNYWGNYDSNEKVGNKTFKMYPPAYIYYDPYHYGYSNSSTSYKHLAYIEFNSELLPYSWNPSSGIKTFKYYCDYRKKALPAPNLAVSTPGFHAPIVNEYPAERDYFPKQKDSNLVSNISHGPFLGYPCTPSSSAYKCPGFYAYTSLYGLVLMSFGEKGGQESKHRYETFLIETLGLSNQARGAYIRGSSKHDDFKDYKTWHERSAKNANDENPTSGSFPGNHQKEADNCDHFWSKPMTLSRDSDHKCDTNVNGTFDNQPYQNGIDGVNFFFFCNGNISK